MKNIIAASASALLALTVSAHATSFVYTGALDSYIVQDSGTYEFTVAGAQGGLVPAASCVVNSICFSPGGALVTGDIYLDAGTTLTILAGGHGTVVFNGDGGTGASGGGMSFIAVGSSPLIVAGGGAGTNRGGFIDFTKGEGQVTTGNGQGGPASMGGNGGAGAGWDSDGAAPLDTFSGRGGFSAEGNFQGGLGYIGDPSHLGPGNNAAFGGGGGGGWTSGGGGAGYTGGAGSEGGGSFIDPSATNVNAIAGGNASGRQFIALNGYVTLNFLGAAVPEPATWVMFLIGFGAVGFSLRQRRHAAAGA